MKCALKTNNPKEQKDRKMLILEKSSLSNALDKVLIFSIYNALTNFKNLKKIPQQIGETRCIPLNRRHTDGQWAFKKGFIVWFLGKY